MKKTKLFKHILACTLVLSLTASDIVPAMAAEIQTFEDVEAEITTPEETTGTEETPTEGTEAAESADGETYNEPAAQAEGDPVIDDFTVSTSYRGQWNISYSTSNCTSVELVVKNAAGAEVYTRTYDVYADGTQSQSIYWDDLYSIAVGTYTFTLTPKKAGEDGSGDITGEAKTQTLDVAAPTVSGVTVSVSGTGSTGFYLNVSYSGDASEYKVVVTNAAGMQVASTWIDYSGESVWVREALVSGARYTVTVTPEGDYGIQGTPQSVVYAAPVVPALTGLAVKEMTPNGFEFTHSALPEDAGIRYQYSENATFNEELADVYTSDNDTLYYSELEPGVKYYVRACLTMSGIQGAYSNVVSVEAPVAEVTSIGTEINDTDVTLTMYTGYGQRTGFEVYRKSGKKYIKLSTTSSRVFTDTGLKKDTKYSYRVRAIYYNINTKKTAYGEYAYVSVETGKAALNLKASAAGKTSIKLTWSKVAGASGYDVYRSTGYSDSRTNKAGEDYDFSKYELVKSLGKKSKSYTDKKLTSGETYSYTVKAYKTVKGKKKYFTEASVSATTKFGFNTSVYVYKQAQNPKTGKVALAWKQIPQAQGYLIERYDDKTETWVSQAKLTKASKTSYTLPASPAGKTVRYRIRAYKGNKYTNPTSINVTGSIAVVTGVKATATAEGVRVSWNAVPNASYYRVYRTIDESASYNADLKAYGYNNAVEVKPQVFVQADAASHYYCTLGKSTIKMRRPSNTTADAAALASYRALRYQYPVEQKGYSYSYGSNDDDDYYYNGYDESYWDEVSGTYIKMAGIKGTSVMDYNYSVHDETLNPDGVTVKKDDVTLCGPQEGVPYHYFVVAYAVQSETEVAAPGTTPLIKYYRASSYGDSKSASAAYAGTMAVKAPTVKVKAGKKSATITISKVANAKSYAIYRSTKQKGTYELVGITTKTKYKDSKLTSKKKYYYKVKAIGVNSMGTDVVSAFSKVKNVKVK